MLLVVGLFHLQTLRPSLRVSSQRISVLGDVFSCLALFYSYYVTKYLSLKTCCDE